MLDLGIGKELVEPEGLLLMYRLSEGESFASGSADNTMRLWRGAACTRVFRGYTGPVTCLVALPSGGSASLASVQRQVRARVGQ